MAADRKSNKLIALPHSARLKIKILKISERKFLSHKFPNARVITLCATICFSSLTSIDSVRKEILSNPSHLIVNTFRFDSLLAAVRYYQPD